MAKNDALKKHHFWILFAAAAVFIPLAVLLMWVLGDGAVKAGQKAYDEKDGGLKQEPKTKGQLLALEERKDDLSKEKDKLHVSNFERQEKDKVFEWPTGNNPNLIFHNEQKYKFGHPVRNRETEFERQVLGPVFEREYTQFARELEPTRFAGGSWQAALRYVSEWGRVRVDPGEFWLALEDYWVQKAVLRTLVNVNKTAALFKDVTPKDADAPLKRRFENRVWQLDLEVKQQGNKQVMSGYLKNLTDRLQVLGMDKTMRVKVWLDEAFRKDQDGKPAELREHDFEFVITGKIVPEKKDEMPISGERVPGKKVLECDPRDVSVPAVRIARVEQVYDEATVPVRLINTIELSFLDHKNNKAALMVPKHLEESTDAAAAAPPTGGDGGEGFSLNPQGGLNLNAGPGGLMGGIGGGGPGGMMGGMGGMAGTGKAKRGGPKQVLLGNKARYLTRTEDVRRMPVALSVVIDRDFTTDLLVAYANSPLRFQVTQTQWQRYRGGTGSAGGDSGGMGGGLLGGLGGSGAMPPGGSGFAPTSGGAGGTGSSDGGSEGNLPGEGPRGGGSFGPPGLGGMPGGTLSNASGNPPPPEASAGLVEFVVYGVVSLYEKKDPKPVDPAAPPAAADPNQPMTPADPAKDPAAPPPANTTPPAGDQPKTPDPAKPAENPADPPKDPADGAPTPPGK